MRDRLSQIWGDPRRPMVMIGLIAFNAGVGLGYFLAKRRQEPPFSLNEKLEMNFNADELAVLRKETPIPNEVVKKTRPKIVNHDPLPEYTSKPSTRVNPETFIKETLESARDIAEDVQEELDEDEGLVRRSIFVQTEDWNYELELTKRDPKHPYVIHKDEFYADERDFTQSTLTFYAGDGIMVSEDDTPVYNHELLTGPLLFGHGSGDPNVVHVRNEKMMAEYEIVYDPGLYSVEVLGLEIENNTRIQDLKHSKQVLKFRQE